MRRIDALAEQFRYLDQLRESGVTNMFGASPYLIIKFGLEREEAKQVLVQWMETYDEIPAIERAKKALKR